MDTRALFDSLIELGKLVAPLIVPGAGEMIAIGERLVETIDHATDTVNAKTPAELDAVRADLDARVSAHVEETVSKLRGDEA